MGLKPEIDQVTQSNVVPLTPTQIVSKSIAAVNTVAEHIDNGQIGALNDNAEDISNVAINMDDVNKAGVNIQEIVALANSIVNINKVADDLGVVNNVNDNLEALNALYTQLGTILNIKTDIDEVSDYVHESVIFVNAAKEEASTAANSVTSLLLQVTAELLNTQTLINNMHPILK